MFTQYLIILICILCMFTMSYYVYHVVHQTKETFDSDQTYSSGNDPQIQGKPYDYFYQFLPDMSQEMMNYINKELDSAPVKAKVSTTPSTFTQVVESNQDIKAKYMAKMNSSMILLPSTKLAIFLGMEHAIHIDAKFPRPLSFQKTASGMTQSEFVSTLIQKYFQNYMVVNAIDAYKNGAMPVYNVLSTTHSLDNDLRMNEAAIILTLLRDVQKIINVHENIPDFSMTRVYASAQDRLEAKASYIFSLLSNVDITNPDVFTHKTDLVPINPTTKTAKKFKIQALQQTRSYIQPFLVALLRSVIESARKSPTPSPRYNRQGKVIHMSSRTGVSSDSASYYETKNVNTLGAGYVPNTLVLLGDTEEVPFKIRFRNIIAIMLKRLQVQNGVQTKCGTNLLEGTTKQHCTTFQPTVADKELSNELLYYLFGFYYKPTTEAMIKKSVEQLKKLAKNNLSGLTKEFIQAGLFDTDELVLLNNVDNRLHFIGPYTACLRCLLMELEGLTGNSSLREDLVIFDSDRST